MGLLDRILHRRHISVAERPSENGEKAYWEEQHWEWSPGRLEGHYRTFYGSFKGLVELSDSGDHRYYIYDPPDQLRRHPQWPCFVFRGRGKYWIHFSQKARNADTGILRIEQILREAMEKY